MKSSGIVSDGNENSKRDSGDGNRAERGEDSRRKRRHTVNHSEQMDGEKDRFNAVLKQTDEPPRAPKEKKLEVKKRKLDAADRMRAV